MNAFKETNHRNDDELSQKWSSKHDPFRRGDVDFSGDPGKTDPSHARDCDINNIVATYHKTGVFPGVDGEQIYADVSDAMSYQEAMQTVVSANDAFMALDAKTRRKFDNDPVQMLRFLEDPANDQEAIALGMKVPRAPTPSPAGSGSAGGQPAAPKRKAKTESASSDEEI